MNVGSVFISPDATAIVSEQGVTTAPQATFSLAHTRDTIDGAKTLAARLRSSANAEQL
jgi:hypothetical protein